MQPAVIGRREVCELLAATERVEAIAVPRDLALGLARGRDEFGSVTSIGDGAP